MSQADFADALLTPERPVPDGLTDPEGRPSEKRFNVYRNNVVVSLSDALETAFPVLRKLVGDEFFRAMAGVHVRAHPPKCAVMMGYGEDMPAFLDSFPPVAHLPYLPDIARLELQLRESYHAADHRAMPPETFAAISPDALMGQRFALAPSLRLLRSAHPALDIWRANTEDKAPKPGNDPQDVAIVRRELDPEPTLLPPGGFAFFTNLLSGETFGAAYEAALADAPGSDLTPILQFAFTHDIFAEETP